MGSDIVCRLQHADTVFWRKELLSDCPKKFILLEMFKSLV